MDVLPLGNGVHVFPGGVNLGALVVEREVVFLDAGPDEGPARKLWRWAEEQGYRPRAAILTHAHADHFGGAHLWAGRNLPLYASAPEGAMMENPMFEPLFLFSGAAAPPALLTKFTLAKPCRLCGIVGPGPLALGPVTVEVVALPGHSPAQIGVRANEVLFCADALFPPEILQKHPLPFCHDLDLALSSLRVVREAARVVPGHGPVLEGAQVGAACAAFQQRLEEIRDLVREAIASPKTDEEILAHIAEALRGNFPDLTAWLLAHTTIRAALTDLVRAGEAKPVLQGKRLLWQRG